VNGAFGERRQHADALDAAEEQDVLEQDEGDDHQQDDARDGPLGPPADSEGPEKSAYRLNCVGHASRARVEVG
jgi:hypothetical protein